MAGEGLLARKASTSWASLHPLLCCVLTPLRLPPPLPVSSVQYVEGLGVVRAVNNVNLRTSHAVPYTS